MRNKLIVKGLVLANLFLGLPGLAQQSELLDLTKKKVEVQANKSKGGLKGSGSASLIGQGDGDRKSLTLPLKLTLTKMDKQKYKLGEAFVYDVSLENVGDQILLIPWEPDKEKVQADPPTDPSKLREVSLYLIFEELKSDAIFGSENIYASSSVPGSFKKLLPGQEVKIRVPGVWYFLIENVRYQVLPTLPRVFTVQAKFILKEGIVKAYEPVFSNSLQVELER